MTIENFSQKEGISKEIFRKPYLIDPANPQKISGEELPTDMLKDTTILLFTEFSGCDGLEVYMDGEEKAQYSQEERGVARDVTKEAPKRNILVVNIGGLEIKGDFQHNKCVDGDVLVHLSISEMQNGNGVDSVL
jgi:hypothetical protein